MIFSWLASHLAVGTLFALLFVSPRDFGRGLYRLSGALSALLLGAGLAGGALKGPSGLGLVAASLVWVALVQQAPVRWLRLSLALLALLGIVALLLGPSFPPRSPVLEIQTWAHPGNSFAAAALMGSVSLAMLVGHWYLVIPGLEIVHLRRMNRLLAACVVCRGLMAAAAVASASPAPPLEGSSVWKLVGIREGFFFWQRVGIGLAGPAVLVALVDRTVRIRSTQSATGLLYVAVILVLIGEMLSRFLYVTVGIPQ